VPESGGGLDSTSEGWLAEGRGGGAICTRSSVSLEDLFVKDDRRIRVFSGGPASYSSRSYGEDAARKPIAACGRFPGRWNLAGRLSGALEK
jgi:hypothetical protein